VILQVKAIRDKLNIDIETPNVKNLHREEEDNHILKNTNSGIILKLPYKPA
jgi:hypothetical protein